MHFIYIEYFQLYKINYFLENGTAWSVGWNKYGQLGLGHNQTTDVISKVNVNNVVDILAGSWNSFWFLK